MQFSSARFFMRREDYQPEQTPDISPFRQFKVNCLKCGSFRTRVLSQYDEESGEMILILLCTHCGQRERLPIK